MSLGKIPLVITSLLISTCVNAEFIEVDLYTANDSLITLDTTTGLEWLDISETTLVSYNDIRANATGLFDYGFRIANRYEIQSLFSSAGITQGPPRSITNTPGVQLLIDYLGCNLCRLSSNLTGGSLFYYDKDIELQGYYAHATYSIDLYGQGYASVDGTPLSSISADNAVANLSTFLVRDSISPVPIPAAAWLFCSGLLGLIGISRKIRHDSK